MTRIGFPALAIAAIVLAGCTKTQIAVKNESTKASKIKVRPLSNDATKEIDFGEVAVGAQTAFVVVADRGWTDADQSGANLNATDGAENGSVILDPKAKNVIRVFPDGTEPIASKP